MSVSKSARRCAVLLVVAGSCAAGAFTVFGVDEEPPPPVPGPLFRRDNGEASRRAMRLHQQGRGADAVALLREAVAKNPRSATAHLDLGRLLRLVADPYGSWAKPWPAEAVRAYRTALALDPKQRTARWELTYAQRLKLVTDESLLRTLESAFRDDPDDLPTVTDLIKEYLRAKRPDAARAIAELAIMRDPDLPAKQGQFAATAAEAGAGPLVIAAFDRALAPDCPRSEQMMIAAHWYGRHGQDAKAVEIYRRILRLSAASAWAPDDLSAWSAQNTAEQELGWRDNIPGK